MNFFKFLTSNKYSTYKQIISPNRTSTININALKTSSLRLNETFIIGAHFIDMNNALI